MFYKIVGVLTGVLEISRISLENTCAGNNVNAKVWLYAFSLHLTLKKTPAELFSGEFCKSFKKTFLIENSWASDSDFIFDIFKSNKYVKISFLLTIFTEKSETKQESQVSVNLGNGRFALQ